MRIKGYFRFVSGWALASLVSSCLHHGGVVFGQPPTTGGGFPAPASGVDSGAGIHSGGVVFGKEPTREQWLDLVSNQSGSMVGDVNGVVRTSPVSVIAPADGVDPSGQLPEASLSIRIRTLDVLGMPLSGVEVEAFRQVNGTSVRLQGRSDASGSLVLDLGSLRGLSSGFLAGPDLFLPELQESTSPLITCRDPRTGHLALLAEPWRRPSWDLRLARPAVVSGRVRGPIQEVGIPGTPYRSMVDASGSWTIPDVPGGRYVVMARIASGAGATASVTVIPGYPVEVPVLEVNESESGGNNPDQIIFPRPWPGDFVPNPDDWWPEQPLEPDGTEGSPGTSDAEPSDGENPTEDSTTGDVSAALPR
ncbi:MAG: carboxypeptidase-like regulatory domain-containing protein [bacterium]|nr:carboxypeptidase-like regulatory domain-containing protein [bacterium]